MLIKNAKFTITEISALNTPTNLDYFKNQNIEVDTTSRTLMKIAHQNKDGVNDSFNLEAEISSHPDSLFVKCFAIKADEMNDNADYFSEEELKKSYGTFVGVPVFTNHNNTDAEQARGKVIHAWWDAEKHGISVIMRIDTVAYPQLARGIKEKYIVASSMGCVLPNSLVKMANGTTRRIDSVNSDDFVITHKGNVRKILNVQIRYKNEDLLRIKTTGLYDPLEVTKNHKVLRLRQQTKCSCGCNGDLPVYKEGSRRGSNYKNKYRNRYLNGHFQNVYNTNPKAKTNNVVLLKKAQKPRTYTDQDFEWVEAGLLTENDVLVFPCNYEKSIINQPSIDEAKLIGYFLAEGSFKKYKNIKKATQFSFNLNEKETFAQEVKTLLVNCFNPEKEVKIYEKKEQNVCLVSITDEQIADWFFKYCGEGSKTKKLHKEFIYWDENIQKAIIGKFINGDGCFTTRNYFNKNKLSKYSSISINTSSCDLIEQFSTSLSRLGIWHTLNKVKANTRTTVIKNKILTFNADEHYVIQINQNYCEKLINFTDKNKQLCNINKTYIKNDDILVCGNYICRKIKNISNFSYTGPVYNLQVQGDNSYVANNTAVKNCQVKYSLCSVCHNYAETPDSYCNCVKERKTRTVDINNQKCNYHKNGTESECPLCGSSKDNIKKFAYKGKVYEHNYGVKFIENSLVVTPACASCGITEVIDTGKFFDKVSRIADQLPKLLKAASQQSLCDDKKCYKIAGQTELDKLNKAIQEIVDVSQSMLKQTNQIDLEFLSDLVTVLADLQEVVDELTQQGYGRLQSVNNANTPQPTVPTTAPDGTQTASQSPVLQNTQPPAGAASSITAPIVPVAKTIQIKQKLGAEPKIKIAAIQNKLIKLIGNKKNVILKLNII